jgi:uncharacterized protein
LGKIVFLLLIAVVLWMLFKGFLKGPARRDGQPASQSPRGEDMVACARCGVNMPRSEAREDGGKFFCLNNSQCAP